MHTNHIDTNRPSLHFIFVWHSFWIIGSAVWLGWPGPSHLPHPHSCRGGGDWAIFFGLFLFSHCRIHTMSALMEAISCSLRASFAAAP